MTTADPIQRSEERIRSTGEIFTPPALVDEILNQLPKELFEDPTKTFLDPSCGDGNFLVQVVRFKIHNGSTVQQALETTYGVELMPDNVQHCKERLLAIANDFDDEIFGIAEAKKKYGHIVDNNIVCADALEYDYSFDGTWEQKQQEKAQKEAQINNLFDFGD